MFYQTYQGFLCHMRHLLGQGSCCLRTTNEFWSQTCAAKCFYLYSASGVCNQQCYVYMYCFEFGLSALFRVYQKNMQRIFILWRTCFECSLEYGKIWGWKSDWGWVVFCVFLCFQNVLMFSKVCLPSSRFWDSQQKSQGRCFCLGDACGRPIQHAEGF